MSAGPSFWERVDQSGGPCACWNWCGGRRGAYGAAAIGRRLYLPHRVVYAECVGPIPPGAVVMHLCDNALCCNPIHLRVGTQSENIQDCVEKGRHCNARPNLKRIKELARRMVRLGARPVDVANFFGVKRCQVTNWGARVNGKTTRTARAS